MLLLLRQQRGKEGSLFSISPSALVNILWSWTHAGLVIPACDRFFAWSSANASHIAISLVLVRDLDI